MSTAASTLPPGFEELQAFAEQWAASTAAERAAKRLNSTEEDRRAFYDAVFPRLQEAITYLDKKHPRDFDEREKTLMNTLLTFAHIALAVEIQKDDEPKQAQVRKYMTITRASADR